MAVSVIIPAYNSEKYIALAIESVLSQTYQDFEIIIVDDGSKDHTKTVVETFDDPRITYIYQKNSGPGIARNTGLDIANGEYIAFLDADDIWSYKKLELQVQKMETNPDIGLVYNWVQYIDAENNLIGKREYNIGKNFYKNLLLGNYVDNGSVPLIRRECFDKVGNFNDMCLAEDWDMWIRIAKEYKFSYVKDFLVKYRIHSAGISKNYKDMEIKLFEILDREFSEQNSNINKIKGKAYAYRYIYLSGVCRNLMLYKDASNYALKAVKTYPLILKEKQRLIEIIKLFMVMSLPKSYFKRMRGTLRSLWAESYIMLKKIRAVMR